MSNFQKVTGWLCSDIVILCGDTVDAKSLKIAYEWGVFETVPEPFSRKNCRGNIFYTGSPTPWGRLFCTNFLIHKGIVFQDLHHSNDKYFCAISIASADRLSYLKQHNLYHHRIYRIDSLQNSKNIQPLSPIIAIRLIKQRLSELGIIKELADALQNFILNDIYYYELLCRPPRGNGFSYLYTEMRSLLKELDMASLEKLASKEQKFILRMIEKNEQGSDFLLDMIQFYRPFLYQRDALQNELNQKQNELNQKQNELNQKQNELNLKQDELNQKQAKLWGIQDELNQIQESISFRVGRAVTWPLRMVRNFFRCLKENGLKYTLKRIPVKSEIIYMKISEKRKRKYK